MARQIAGAGRAVSPLLLGGDGASGAAHGARPAGSPAGSPKPRVTPTTLASSSFSSISSVLSSGGAGRLPRAALRSRSRRPKLSVEAAMAALADGMADSDAVAAALTSAVAAVGQRPLGKEGLLLCRTALRSHALEAQVVCAAARLLCSDVFASPDDGLLCGELGLLNAMVLALIDHSDNAEVVRCSCTALAVLCKADANRARFQAAGGVRVLLDALSSHRSARVLKTTLPALLSFSVGSIEYKRAVVKAGGVALLLSLLGSDLDSSATAAAAAAAALPSNYAVTTAACQVLSTLCTLPAAFAQLRPSRGAPLLSVLRAYPSSGHLSRLAATLLVRYARTVKSVDALHPASLAVLLEAVQQADEGDTACIYCDLLALLLDCGLRLPVEEADALRALPPLLAADQPAHVASAAASLLRSLLAQPELAKPLAALRILSVLLSSPLLATTEMRQALVATLLRLDLAATDVPLLLPAIAAGATDRRLVRAAFTCLRRTLVSRDLRMAPALQVDCTRAALSCLRIHINSVSTVTPVCDMLAWLCRTAEPCAVFCEHHGLAMVEQLARRVSGDRKHALLLTVLEELMELSTRGPSRASSPILFASRLAVIGSRSDSPSGGRSKRARSSRVTRPLPTGSRPPLSGSLAPVSSATGGMLSTSAGLSISMSALATASTGTPPHSPLRAASRLRSLPLRTSSMAIGTMESRSTLPRLPSAGSEGTLPSDEDGAASPGRLPSTRSRAGSSTASGRRFMRQRGGPAGSKRRSGRGRRAYLADDDGFTAELLDDDVDDDDVDDVDDDDDDDDDDDGHDDDDRNALLHAHGDNGSASGARRVRDGRRGSGGGGGGTRLTLRSKSPSLAHTTLAGPPMPVHSAADGGTPVGVPPLPPGPPVTLQLPAGDRLEACWTGLGKDCTRVGPPPPEALPPSSGGPPRVLVYDSSEFYPTRCPVPLPYSVDASRAAGERRRDSLTFDSHFESGNLLRAVQVGPLEYDLLLRPDLHTRAHMQWFYFAVSTGSRAPAGNVKFNIINLVKPSSLFNAGMRPLLYSAVEAESGGRGWRREGSAVAYYNNRYPRPGMSSDCYHTLTFTLPLCNANDVYQIAHTYPYTYSMLCADLRLLSSEAGSDKRVRQTQLCTSLAGFACPLLTITDFTASAKELKARRGIVLSARVHSGETGASWMMRGAIRLLTGQSPLAQRLRRRFVFKVVPMLNPDGVVWGNTRCGLAGVDLNRVWRTPSKYLHPTIYHTKSVIRQMRAMREVLLFVDFHGHSRKKNVFMYGCDEAPTPTFAVRTFPMLVSKTAAGTALFSYNNCSFNVPKGRETAARVVVARELGIRQSYTLEASFCGPSFGELCGAHFSEQHLADMGAALVEAIDVWSCDKPEVRDRLQQLFMECYMQFEAAVASRKARRRKKRGRRKEDAASSSVGRGGGGGRGGVAVGGGGGGAREQLLRRSLLGGRSELVREAVAAAEAALGSRKRNGMLTMGRKSRSEPRLGLRTGTARRSRGMRRRAR